VHGFNAPDLWVDGKEVALVGAPRSLIAAALA